MTDKIIIIIAVGIAIVLLLFYAVYFIDAPISKSTSDWGAFGSYATICVSILSVTLIYVTYREQRESNEITRVELHIVTMTNTLVSLSEKYHKSIDISYDKFTEHFKLTFYDLSNCELDKTIKICTYYYSIAINGDYCGVFDFIFRYTQLCIDYILHEKTLSSENKSLRITELGCILPESMRILFFCWLLVNRHIRLKDYYKSGIFMFGETASPLLEDIVSYVCTGERPSQRQFPDINPDDIIYEDYPKEQFPDTYKRLY